MDLREIPEQLGRRHPWEVARARFFSQTLTETLTEAGSGQQPRAVLDVGAGDGYLSAEVLARLPVGSEVVCVDEHYTDADLGRLGAGAARGMKFSRTVPERRFDIVLLLDVLEHVEDDVGFLRRLVIDNLAPDGVALVSVPAWPSLYTEHDRALRHHRRYTPAACRALLAAAELDVLRSGGLFHALLPIRALAAAREAVARRLGRPARAPGDLGEWRRGALFSALVERALRADNALSRRLAEVGLALPGLSFWALARSCA
jgi:SAM-dependent methyltransferase